MAEGLIGIQNELFNEIIPEYSKIAANQSGEKVSLTTPGEGDSLSLLSDVAEVRELTAKILSLFDRMAEKCEDQAAVITERDVVKATDLRGRVEGLLDTDSEKTQNARTAAGETIRATKYTAVVIGGLATGAIAGQRTTFANALENLGELTTAFDQAGEVATKGMGAAYRTIDSIETAWGQVRPKTAG